MRVRRHMRAEMAALLAPPRDSRALARQVERVLREPALRDSIAGQFHAQESAGNLHGGKVDVAGTAEIAGGVLLGIGLLTPLAAALRIAVMTLAIAIVRWRHGPWVSAIGRST